MKPHFAALCLFGAVGTGHGRNTRRDIPQLHRTRVGAEYHRGLQGAAGVLFGPDRQLHGGPSAGLDCWDQSRSLGKQPCLSGPVSGLPPHGKIPARSLWGLKVAPLSIPQQHPDRVTRPESPNHEGCHGHVLTSCRHGRDGRQFRDAWPLHDPDCGTYSPSGSGSGLSDQPGYCARRKFFMRSWRWCF
jgi:hypothetical protein